MLVESHTNISAAGRQLETTVIRAAPLPSSSARPGLAMPVYLVKMPIFQRDAPPFAPLLKHMPRRQLQRTLLPAGGGGLEMQHLKHSESLGSSQRAGSTCPT